VVLFGGSSGTSLGDTWEWNGLEWLPAPTAIAPSARFGTPLVSRGASRSLLLFGGQGVHQGPLLGDTWEMDYAGCVPGGVGSPGGGLACGCSTEPRIGTTFCVSFSHPPPQGAGWGLLLLAPGPCLATPFPIAPPGVCVQTLVRLAPALIVPGAGDPLRFCIALPAHPALLGQQLCLQGAALDVGVCLRATDAVQAVVYR
jgi:hypothetical protein